MSSQQPAPPHLAVGQLVTAWRWVLAIGWSGLVVSLMIVAGAGQITGRNVWWFDPDRGWSNLVLMFAPFVLPVATISTAATNRSRFAVELSFAATAVITLSAVVDRHSAQGAAAVTAMLALGALCLSIGSLSGRVRRPRH